MTSDFLKKFLTGGQIEGAIDDVVRLAGPVRIALIGGVALQLYGSDRLTKDVDFVAEDVFDLDEGTKVMSIGGVKGMTRQGIPVDILVGGEYPSLREEALSEARSFPGISVPVATVEHIMVLKLVAGRQKDELDIETMLMLHVPDLDKTRAIIREHVGKYAVKDFDSFVDEVAWREANDKKEE
jgi:predicted nucleotidyltransferase